MAALALCLLISSRILQDGTAICLILYDLCFVLVYLSLPCHISSGILLPDTDVLKTLRPFHVYSYTSLILVSSRSSVTPRGLIRKRTCCLCGSRWFLSLLISLLLNLTRPRSHARSDWTRRTYSSCPLSNTILCIIVHYIALFSVLWFII